MNSLHSLNQAVASDRGAVLPWLALLLPVLVLFMVFVVDVSNWFEHKRHLQLQADAGALAGGGAFTFPCSDANIEALARKYAGDPGAPAPYNTQVPPTDQGNVHVLINSTDFWNDGGTNHSDGGSPCEAKMVDVKITEADLPLFFRIPGLFGAVPAINARARVQIQALDYLSGGALPIAVPDVDPSAAKATFIDEATGAVLATTPLTNTGAAGGLSIWDNAAAPVSVPISASKIGVRVTLSGNPSSTTCGAPLVDCYDLGSPDGVVFVRGYPAGGRVSDTDPPVARDVRLVTGTCDDAYFFTNAATCTVALRAEVSRGSVPPADLELTAFGANCPNNGCGLTYDAAGDRWQGPITVSPQAGPIPIRLKWQQKNGSITGLGTCTTNFRSTNPCQAFFGGDASTGEVVQRTFGAIEDRSGPIKLAQVWENGLFWANSFERGTTHQLVVKVGVTPNLQNAKDVNDPVVTLRVVGGSRNQSLDCDPNYSNLFEELAYGCRPGYTTNSGTACPATAPTLWSSPQPWDCVAIQTGSATNQVPRGLNLRVLGDEKPTTCTSPNNWSQFPNIPPGDPRVLNVFITPFGSFGGSGSGVVPVVKLGTFYVTGWTASGSGFKNPCEGNGDDPVPNNDAGNIVGHFIKYVYGLNNGGGSGQTCDFTSFGSCIAVLTE